MLRPLYPRGPRPLVDLLGDLVGPVPHALRLEDHDRRPLGKERGEWNEATGEQAQKAFRPGRDDPLCKLGQHRVGVGEHQLCRSGHRVAVCDQLPAGRQLRTVDLLERPLGGQRELAQGGDLVAPELGSHRSLERGRKDIQDAAPDGKLASSLHDVVALVAELHEPACELIEGRLGAGFKHHRVDVASGRRHQLGGPLRRGHHDPGSALYQLAEDVQPATHRLDRGRHRLARQDLPTGKDLGPVATEERLDVVGNLLGLFGSGCDRQDGPIEVARESGKQERPCGVRSGYGRARLDECPHALVGKQVQ